MENHGTIVHYSTFNMTLIVLSTLRQKYYPRFASILQFFISILNHTGDKY